MKLNVGNTRHEQTADCNVKVKLEQRSPDESLLFARYWIGYRAEIDSNSWCSGADLLN